MTNSAGGDLWIAQVHVSEYQKEEKFFVINGRGDIVGVAFSLADAEWIKEQIVAGINAADVESQLSENLKNLKDRFYVAARAEPKLDKEKQIIEKKKVKQFFVINSTNQVVGQAFEFFEEARKWAQEHRDAHEMDRQVPPRRFQP